MVKGCTPDQRRGFALQSNGGYQLNDHIPVVMNADFGAKLSSRKKTNWIDKNHIRMAILNKDDERRQALKTAMDRYIEEYIAQDKNWQLTNAAKDGMT